MNNIDIWYSSLTERAFMWKSKEVKLAKEWVKVFTWDKKDITNKFLFIVEQYFETWTSRIINQWDKSIMYIAIENTKEAKEWLILSLQKEILNNIH